MCVALFGIRVFCCFVSCFLKCHTPRRTITAIYANNENTNGSTATAKKNWNTLCARTRRQAAIDAYKCETFAIIILQYFRHGFDRVRREHHTVATVRQTHWKTHFFLSLLSSSSFFVSFHAKFGRQQSEKIDSTLNKESLWFHYYFTLWTRTSCIRRNERKQRELDQNAIKLKIVAPVSRNFSRLRYSQYSSFVNSGQHRFCFIRFSLLSFDDVKSLRGTSVWLWLPDASLFHSARMSLLSSLNVVSCEFMTPGGEIGFSSLDAWIARAKWMASLNEPHLTVLRHCITAICGTATLVNTCPTEEPNRVRLLTATVWKFYESLRLSSARASE